jgi:hypothetical protein
VSGGGAWGACRLHLHHQVRILEKKEKFDKGKQRFSKEIYTMDKKEGYKIIVNGTSRKLKPAKLLWLYPCILALGQ